MAFKNICVEIFPTATADCLDEVDEMVTVTAERLDLFALVVPRDTTIETHRSAFAVDDNAHPLAAKRRHFAGALGLGKVMNLIKQRGRGKIVVDYLRVGDITGVVE